MMAELYGKSTGTNRAKGGSMHITDMRVGMLGVNPIVGAGATHAVGAALSARVLKNNQVSAAFFGDGAAGIGALHEAIDLGLHLEASRYLRLREQRLRAGDARRVRAYPRLISRIALPDTVYRGASSTARTSSRSGKRRKPQLPGPAAGHGPSLIECKTYRYYGHHQGDDTRRYRSAEEEEQARARDCIQAFRRHLIETEEVSPAELDQLENANRALIDEAVAYAEASPVPDARRTLTDVFSD